MTSWILLLRKKGVKKNKEVHETAPSEGPFCQAHNLELLYFCLIAAAAVLGNKKWYFVTKIVLTYCEKKLF